MNWKVTGYKQLAVENQDGNTIALCPGYSPHNTSIENAQYCARIIANGPSMLDALEDMIKAMSEAVPSGIVESSPYIKSRLHAARMIVRQVRGVSLDPATNAELRQETEDLK